MNKGSGLGANFYIDGVDLTGDINSLSNITTSQALLDVTGLAEFAHERIQGLGDGNMDWVNYFNPAIGAAFPTLKTRPTTDRIASYIASGTTLGGDGASLVAKQISHDGTRGTDGSYTFKVSCQANGYGLEWGTMLTAGKRTDTAATNGTGVNFTASQSFGFQAYMHVFAFTGTDVTVKLQDSADNVTFADIASGAFTQITSTSPQAQRIAVGGTATVRQYVRAVTVTTGGFTSVQFSVQLTQNRGVLNF